MPENFDKLSQEFNETAARIAAGDGVYQMAVAKYTLLMRHKAQTPGQKQELTARFLDAALTRLGKTVDGIPHMRNFSALQLEALYGVFRPLAAPENISFLPEGAADRLANAALKLVRTLETYEKHDFVTYEHHSNITKYYAEFTGFMVETAQAVKNAEDARRPETKSDLTIGKPPTIRPRTPKGDQA